MNENYNKLTFAESERLAMLAEECGEIIQMVGKILRHGYESYHPDDPEKITNRDLLSREITDFMAVYNAMVFSDDIKCNNLYLSYLAWERKFKWTHYQDKIEL